ncbi:MAG TPA: S8 family peptidase [Vicinamibacterales bacterium]|nr:S8 family peptidase [Vicinamibacterales bacterium]
MSIRLSGSLKKIPVAVLVAVVALFTSFPRVRAGHRAHLSLDLLAHEAQHSTGRKRVILTGDPTQIAAIAARHQLQVLRLLENGAVLSASSSELTDLAGDGDVPSVSGDLPVRPWMTVSNLASAADQVRAGTSGLLGIGGISGVNGSGIGVAVIDSGVNPHPALKNRIVANVSLVTGDPSYLDAFGHGTHVAGIIAGSGNAAVGVTSLYSGGIAPGANIVNVRVLGADGSGLTSDVIAGIDWAVANRTKYNIRILNLSLGHPVAEPAALDPMDQAVARAVQAGLVVVVAAGNQGVAANGAPIMGGIMSPGNSPLAITVGAVNTWATVNRGDDTIATYSSRGPTQYDLAVKPDLAAPGNKIISLEAQNSYLARNFSYLHVAGTPSNGYFMLSGTSMATPMVSGAAALLLSGNPGLSGGQLKLVLQMGASYMPSAGLMGAGAGNANFWASRKMANTGLLSTVTNLIGGLTTTSSGAAFWDAGTLTNRVYGGIGLRLLSAAQLPLFWLNPSLLNVGDLNLAGLTNPLGVMPKNPLLWGDVAKWANAQEGDQVIWGTEIYNPSGQQVIWGTSTDGDQVIWGTTLVDVNAE